MKRFILLFFGTILFFFSFSARSQNITQHAELSLITCSPGDELYSIFGHSAIRLHDTTTNTDLIFNYGVFDFSTPHFYWKFIRGKLKYQLAIQDMNRFLLEYKRDGRLVKEEKFKLTQTEKNKMIRFLRHNYLPQNRYYLYDFFYNNCSTKIWDVTKSQVSTGVEFDTSIYRPKSFRDLLYEYLGSVPWAKLGIDILLGLPTDKIASFKEQMYLPDYLSRNMAHTYRSEPLNHTRKLLGPSHVILKRDPQKSDFSKPFFTPMLAGWILFGLVLLLSILSGPGGKRWFDFIFMSVLGLLGLVLVFLWIVSNHQQMDGNLNILWANPLGVFFTWFALRKKMRSAAWIYGIVMVFALVTILFWNVIPQDFNQALIPLNLALIIRGADRFFPVCCPSMNLDVVKRKFRFTG